MHQTSSPKPGSETPESQKVPFLLVKSIREAILDETFQPGDRLVEVEVAEKFAVSRQPVREALLVLEKRGHGHNKSLQGCDGKTSINGRSRRYRGTKVGPYLSGPQTGAPAPFPSRL